jgi:hypothetical protein
MKVGGDRGILTSPAWDVTGANLIASPTVLHRQAGVPA